MCYKQGPFLGHGNAIVNALVKIPAFLEQKHVVGVTER